jgi:hypothetical protein
MEHRPSEVCADPQRRVLIRERGGNGIDDVEVGDDQTTLTVTCFTRVPDTLVKENVVIDGGVRITQIRVVDVRLCDVGDTEQDDCFTVFVDRPGDLSTYTLSLVDTDENGLPTERPLGGFDPRYSRAEFSFNVERSSDIDCVNPGVCAPTPPPAAPDINYLAKDYSSFRQVILDRLALTIPDWQETHVPDMGVAIVELMAYVGDQLSYFQDAVATEAYLNTARRRISVRRHVRLLGYAMHEGCNARTWVFVAVTQDIDNEDLSRLQFIAGLGDQATLLSDDPAGALTRRYQVFEPVTTAPIRLFEAHNEISIYTWSDRQCCLLRGSVSATLTDGWAADPEPARQHTHGSSPKPRKGTKAPEPPGHQETANETSAERVRPRKLRLQPGDYLLFEEIKGPTSQSVADADPAHRHVVRLRRVEAAVDPLNGQPIIHVWWGIEDALPFDLCVSSRMHPKDVSVARGNILLVDHGAWVTDENLGSATSRFYPSLKTGPLTFREEIASDGSASSALARDPRVALPQIQLSSIAALPDGSGSVFSFAELQDPHRLAVRLQAAHEPYSLYLRERLSAGTLALLLHFDPLAPLSTPLARALTDDMLRFVRRWSPHLTLLNSGAQQLDFVVEIDDDGITHLRFGDGRCGCAPDLGESFSASYRVGNGTEGNIGLEVIQHNAIAGQPVSGISQATNKVSASGGTDPETIDSVRRVAPGSFLNDIERAVTPEDYAALAERYAEVQRAAATLLWTGTRYEASVAIDPLGSDRADEGLLQRIRRDLLRYRRIGHDLSVVPATYVPLDVAVTVDVTPDYLRAHVKAALLDVFSARVLPDGRIGFFHPDNLTFGQSVYVSRIVAVAQGVAGVLAVKVTRLQRLFADPAGEIEAGVLSVGALEIAQVDNDPLFPERGVLHLNLRGGR